MSKKKFVITFDGKWCSVHTLKLGTTHKKHIYCACCREEVRGEGAHLLVNNWKLFPNCFVHERCCPEPNSELMYQLMEDYAQFKAFDLLRHEYKHWAEVNCEQLTKEEE